MIVLRKQFSGTKILNTNGAPGFIKGRKYDTDLDRLGRMDTSQRELQRTGLLNQEMKKLGNELNQGRLGKWRNT